MQRIDQQTVLLSSGVGRLPVLAAPSIVPLDDGLAGPWPRWFARTFDVWWQTALVASVLGYALCQTSPAFLRWLETPFGWKLFGLVCMPAGLLLDALVLAMAGNTPGKALLGLQLVTNDGRVPRFAELARRNLRVWSAGLGFGLPAISLFTMARQALRLRRGEAASYDDRAFVVEGRPVGWRRKAVFGTAFLSLFVLIVSLDAADRQDSRETAVMLAAPPFSWTNPATGRTVNIAPQWKVETRTSDGGLVEYLFTQHSGHALVMLVRDEGGEASLRHYARTLTLGLAGRYDLPGGHFRDFRGMPSWVGRGEEKHGPARVQIRVVQADGKAWRLTVLQAPPAAYTDDLVEELSGALWDTVVPRVRPHLAPRQAAR